MISETNKNRILLTLCLLSVPLSIVYCASVGNWSWIIIAAIIFQFHKIIGNNIAMHRYFAHRSFQTGPIRHRLLAIYTIFLAAKSPISWTMNHRHHHKFSDKENDTHSPKNNFLSAVLGLWEFNGYEWFKNKGVAFNVKDLLRDPTVVKIEKYYYEIWSALILITLLIDWKITLFFFLLPAGYYHIMANLFNTIGHYKILGSYRNFDLDDRSQNHWAWGMITFGEGFHNNHHNDQKSYSNKIKWYEFDFTAWVIRRFFKIN